MSPERHTTRLNISAKQDMAKKTANQPRLISMRHSHPLPGAIFSEPVFSEGKFLPDPNGFHVPHPSDSATYAKLGNLIYTQSTAIPPSRLAAGGLYGLGRFFGAVGPAVVGQINKRGRPHHLSDGGRHRRRQREKLLVGTARGRPDGERFQRQGPDPAPLILFSSGGHRL